MRAEIVEDKLAVLTHRAGNLLHGLNPGAHRLPAPFVEELAGPGGRIADPELLKGFLQQTGADGSQVVTKQIAEPELLLVTEVIAPFEQLPTGLLQDRVAALRFYATGFSSTAQELESAEARR